MSTAMGCTDAVRSTLPSHGRAASDERLGSATLSSSSAPEDSAPQEPREPPAVLVKPPTASDLRVNDAESAVGTDARSVYPPPATRATERALPPLPRPDRGRQAYLFLFSALTVETVVWGIPSAYGVFLDYYQREGVGAETSGGGLLAIVAALSRGFIYILGPPIALLLNPRPRWRVPATRIGALVAVAGLLLSAFAKTAWQLLLTQGLMYSLGGAFVYYPTFSFLSEWFVERRGLAQGVCFAGTAIGGLVYPFVLQGLLSSYGPARTLQVLSAATFLIFLASFPFLHPRIPVGRQLTHTGSHRDHPAAPSQKKMWTSVRWWAFNAANVLQAFGYFLPSLYLPTFATSLGLRGSEGSSLLAAVNGSSVVSRIAVGLLSDRMAPHKLGAAVTACSSLSVLLLWGTATSLAPSMIFSLLLGFAAGGWTSLYTTVAKDMSEDDPRIAQTLFGFLSFTRGLGSLLTAPVSSYLMAHPLNGASSRTGYGIANGEYGSMIIFCGVTLAAAAGMEVAISG